LPPANVRKKLSDLVRLETILAETVAQGSDGATPGCPVLDILDAGRQSCGAAGAISIYISNRHRRKIQPPTG
jgi:hypothetical protein